jgi:hypothetical protein
MLFTQYLTLFILEAMACVETVSLADDLQATKLLISPKYKMWRPSLHGDQGYLYQEGKFLGGFIYPQTAQRERRGTSSNKSNYDSRFW